MNRLVSQILFACSAIFVLAAAAPAASALCPTETADCCAVDYCVVSQGCCCTPVPLDLAVRTAESSSTSNSTAVPVAPTLLAPRADSSSKDGASCRQHVRCAADLKPDKLYLLHRVLLI